MKTIFKILGLLIPLAALYFYYESRPTEKEMKTQIVHLEAANDSIKNENKIIKWQNDSLVIKLFESTTALDILKEKDKELLGQIQALTTQMNTIKIKYEKAANYTRNYNSDSITSYFSNLK